MKDVLDCISLFARYFELKRRVTKRIVAEEVKQEPDERLVVMLKGLSQSLLHKDDIENSACIENMLHEFLTSSGYGCLELSTHQTAILAYADSMSAHLIKQCKVSRHLMYKIALIKISYAMLLLSEDGAQNESLLQLRRYTELILRALIGWNDHSGKRSVQLFQSINVNYKQLVSLFPLSPDKIQHQYESLIDIIKQYQKQSLLLEQRITQGLNRRVLSGEADQEIEQIFNQLLSGKSFPKSLLILLEKYWRKYLHTVFLRDGINSDVWEQASKLTSKLARAWHQESSVEQASRHKLLQELLPLLSKLHLAEDSVKVLLTELTELNPDTTEWIYIDKKDFVKLEAFKAQSQALIDEVKRLRVGDWILFEKDGQRIRAKLLYKNLLQDRYVFANLSGQEVLDCTGIKLSQRLQKNNLVILLGQVSCDFADQQVLVYAENKIQQLTSAIEQKKAEIELKKQHQEKEKQDEKQRIEKMRKAAEEKQRQLMEEQERIKREQQAALQQKIAEQQRAKQIEEQTQLLQHITAGAWIEFIDEQGNVSLNKISFILKSTGKLVFANELGMKTRECSRDQLALEIVDGRANINDWGSQFENRLESLVVGQKEEINERKGF